MIPPDELKRLRALCEAATPGPWVPKHLKSVYLRTGEVEHEVRSTVNGKTVAAIRFRSQGGEIGDDQEDHDVAFLAAARTALPQLLDEVERLKSDLETQRRAAAAIAQAAGALPDSE